MTALAADRKNNSKTTGPHSSSGPLAASTTLYANGLVAVNTAGYLVPAAATAGLRVVGVATRQTINSGAAGAKDAQWAQGVYCFANDATYPVSQADVGRVCYVKDDQTVQDERGSSTVAAGIVFQYESSSKIWVLVGPDIVANANGAGGAGIELVTSGALSLFVDLSNLSIDATKAYTLANGLFIGQRKRVRMTVGANTPVGTLTPATAAAGHDATYVFRDTGGGVDLIWQADGWAAERFFKAGVETLTAGQSAARLKLYHVFAVADTVDVLQPDGVVVGEMSIWAASANSGTPVGTVSGVFRTVVGGAGTDINFNAAGDAAAVIWDGAKWAPMGALTSATIS